VQFEGVDLMLAVGADLDGPGGADHIAWAGQRVRAKASADVDCGVAGEGDSLRVADDEVGIAVAVGIDPLDVDDPPHRFAADRVSGRAVRRRDSRESVKTVAMRPF
jgi:hypothetical protein